MGGINGERQTKVLFRVHSCILTVQILSSSEQENLKNGGNEVPILWLNVAALMVAMGPSEPCCSYLCPHIFLWQGTEDDPQK